MAPGGPAAAVQPPAAPLSSLDPCIHCMVQERPLLQSPVCVCLCARVRVARACLRVRVCVECVLGKCFPQSLQSKMQFRESDKGILKKGSLGDLFLLLSTSRRPVHGTKEMIFIFFTFQKDFSLLSPNRRRKVHKNGFLPDLLFSFRTLFSFITDSPPEGTWKNTCIFLFPLLDQES